MNKVHDIITERILGMLESGTVPWHKPWKGMNEAPKSLVSGKPYRGINALMLVSAGYSSPWWMSFKQAKERHGHIRKGEKGWPCIYWNYQEKEDERSGEIKADGNSCVITRSSMLNKPRESCIHNQKRTTISNQFGLARRLFKRCPTRP